MRKDSIQGGIWLIGIGLLAITGYWWPGIMFVIGVSSLVSGSLQGAVWMFGIGLVAHFGVWWPGIIIVVGISLLFEAIYPEKKKREEPDAAWDEEADTPSPMEKPGPAPEPAAFLSEDEASVPSWVPAYCPACGGPLSGPKVIVHSHERVSCPWCATVIEK